MKFFSNLRLSAKLGLGFGLLLAGLIAGSLYVMHGLQSSLATVYNDRVVPLNNLKAVADKYAVNIVDTSHKTRSGNITADEALRRVTDARAVIDKEWKAYAATQMDSEEKKLADEANAAMQAADEHVDELTAILRKRDQKALAAFCANSLYPAIDPVSDSVSKLVELQLRVAKEEYTRGEASARLSTILFPTISLFFGVLITVLITRSITRPVAALSSRLESLESHCVTGLMSGIQAMEAGDLTLTVTPVTTPVENPAKDELGRMCQTFNSMLAKVKATLEAYEQTRQSLCGIVSSVQQSAQAVAGASEELTTAAQQTGQAANEIAATIQEVAQAAGQSATTSQEMAKGSEQQARSATEAAGAMERLSSAISHVQTGGEKARAAAEQADEGMRQASRAVEEVARSAQQMAEAAQQASSVAKTGGRAVEETVQSMQRIQEQVAASTEKVRLLDQKSQEIGAIVETIDQIAEQTNLLALNAAIEAARAGEHGKGFAVVADEVRKLAERAAGATKEIGALIGSVRQEVNEVVSAMQQSNGEVTDGAKRSQEAGESLAQILAAASKVAEEVEGVSAIAEEMSASVQQVLATVATVRSVAEEQGEAVSEMAAGSSQVSGAITTVASISQETAAGAEEMSASAEEVSASAQNVSAAVEEQTASVEQVSAAAGQLNEMAAQLQELVSRFKVEEGSDALSPAGRTNASKPKLRVAA
jgi:methyl-accepting chemotaxis protein